MDSRWEESANGEVDAAQGGGWEGRGVSAGDRGDHGRQGGTEEVTLRLTRVNGGNIELIGGQMIFH